MPDPIPSPISSTPIRATSMLPPTPPGFNGVVIPDPATIASSIARQVESVFKVVPQDHRTAVFAVATYKNGKVGTNLVLAHRVGDNLKIEGHIGKTWGEPVEGGVNLVWSVP